MDGSRARVVEVGSGEWFLVNIEILLGLRNNAGGVRLPPMNRKLIRMLGLCLGLAGLAGEAATVSFETPAYQFSINPENGSYEIVDKASAVVWRSNPFQARFGEIALNLNGKVAKFDLARCEVSRAGDGLKLVFKPLTNGPNNWVQVNVSPQLRGQALEFACVLPEPFPLDRLTLLDNALWTTDAEQGYVAVPAREGLLIPANSGLAFNQAFGTSEYEGCHMEMLGVVKQGAAALITWHDPYVRAEVRSSTNQAPWLAGKQALATSLVLRKTAKSLRMQFLGRGDYVTIARAYREIAREKGYLVTWDEKLKGHPERAKLFGAVNAKLWSCLSRSMNDESTQEVSSKVNWTFDEAAQVAEHFKNDLQLDKVFFILGGWIKRGYDNQHPDILPTAPECGGDPAFADASRRILKLGYVYGLHDNYQDMYRDAPSWDTNCIQKNADGSLFKGGKWAGGRAYFTCAQKAVELAKRPQNLTAVKQLSGANAYFIDTTYAVGLQECFDPKHPLTRWDDMKYKQELSDYSRGVFGIFGSECGREWAIPHADFFEGLTGVGGRYYHFHAPGPALETRLGATVIPLFELVYRDCIAMYGKYGYDASQAAEYVLHHILIGRPLHYHSIPSHLYWQEKVDQAKPLGLRPSVASFEATGARQFNITYRWGVEQPVPENWRIFVHFTDAAGNIKFQNDQQPNPALPAWKVGEVTQGPFKVSVPEGMKGSFIVRMGLFRAEAGFPRPALVGAPHGERSVIVGRLLVDAGKLEFQTMAQLPENKVGDPGLFVRADNGWAEGRHTMDRFIKNTYEILSPLYELTARVPMTQHQFLTPDRLVQRSVFGAGAGAVDVVGNKGGPDYRCQTKNFGTVMLPPFGFVIESETFAALCVSEFKGNKYPAPVLFTLRSQDGRPLKESKKLAVFHGFGKSGVETASLFSR